MADWTNELAFQFLELYSAEPTLYDPKHPHYKNKKMINNAWSRIQQGLSVALPMTELKKKKDSLMASFRYNIRRKKEATLTGDVFKTAWFAFDYMYDFLGPLYENDSTNNAVDSEPVLEFVGFDALDDISPGDDSPSTPQELITPENKLDLTAQEYKSEPSPHESKLKAALTKRKQPIDGQQQGNQSPVDQASTTSKNDDEDECDLYGKLIAKKLRKMPEDQRERLMYEIQGLFLKASQLRPRS